MKAIILRDVVNQTSSVFVQDKLSDTDADRIREAAKKEGYMVILRDVTHAKSVEDILQEIAKLP